MQVKYYLVAAAAAGMLVSAGTAMAFHGGGVAHCDGCHTMHNSADNPVGGASTIEIDLDGDGTDEIFARSTAAAENGLLLKGSDPSSTCLNCHDGNGRYHINSVDGSNTTEGGDFYWVNNTYTVMVRGNARTFGGEGTGHNVVATDWGYGADSTNAQAPGGTYPSATLGCQSCHDPHGTKDGGTAAGQMPISGSGSYDAPAGGVPAGTMLGNYRLLRDELGGLAPAPIAKANSYDGATTRYGSGMSEWCLSCHSEYDTGHKHPVAEGIGELATNYNLYVATGNFGGAGQLPATRTSIYDELVPVETLQAHDALDVTAAPSVGDTAQVMCLTCHRAHASANENAGRWDFEAEFLAESHALEATDLPATAIPYYRNGAEIDVVADYGQYQRSLCNKCHVED